MLLTYPTESSTAESCFAPVPISSATATAVKSTSTSALAAGPITKELTAAEPTTTELTAAEPTTAESTAPEPTTAGSTIDPTIDPAFGARIDGVPCQRLDADLWFAETPAELEEAKAHCLLCPVRVGCLAGALERREPWGVWGGEIFEQGTVIVRKRPRGRPRKASAGVAA